MTSDDFVAQYGIFGIDKPGDRGQLSFQVGFAEEIPKSLTGLIIIQSDAYFTVDGFGAVQNTPSIPIRQPEERSIPPGRRGHYFPLERR